MFGLKLIDISERGHWGYVLTKDRLDSETKWNAYRGKPDVIKTLTKTRLTWFTDLYTLPIGHKVNRSTALF